MTGRWLEVVDLVTGEVVEQVDISRHSDRSAERVMAGMLINMNTDRFFVRDTAWNEREEGEAQP